MKVYTHQFYRDVAERASKLELVADAARVLVSANEGFMDTAWQAQQWGPLERALEALDKEELGSDES